MNTTNYLPVKNNAIRSHVRRNSLETLHKIKQNSTNFQPQNFRNSCTSFDKISKKPINQLPQIRYQKQMDYNIYFNPQTRNNFFKNLIDSYFEKSDKNSDHSKFAKIDGNSMKGSYLLRRNILNKKNQPKERAEDGENKKLSDLFSSTTNTQMSKTLITQKNSKHQLKPETFNKAKAHLQKIPLSQQKDPMIEYVESGTLTLQKTNPNQHFQQPSFLKRITQDIDDEDIDQEIQITSKQDVLNTTFMRSQSSFSKLEDKKVLSYENSVIRLFTSWQNEKKYRIKQFKSNIFLKRHNRALQCGAYSFWKPYKFNELSLIIPFLFPLKDLLFKLLPHPTSPQFCIIQPKQFFYRLTANHCQQLFLLFRQFIKDIHKTSKKVINNKINLSNLFYVNGKLCLGDWEYSAFKEENKIQGNHFQSRVEPILKCEQEWLISPEYLAPEILQSIEDASKPFDIWEYQNSADIYSIGLSFLEIVTLIPMWMQNRTSIKSKIMKPREGFLCTQSRTASKIGEKQKLLVSRFPIFLQRELAEEEKNWRFFNLLLRMIEPNPSKRITIDQLMKEIE